MKRMIMCAMFMFFVAVVAYSQPPIPPWQGGPGIVVKSEILYTPDSSVKYALADLLSLPPELQPFVRYLSLYNVPKAQRRDVAKIVSFVINSLGTRRQIYIPVFVGGSDETVIRVNIDDYAWDPNSWERLVQNGSGVRPFPEPYFHAFVQKVCSPAGTKINNATVKMTMPGEKKQVKETIKEPVKKIVKEFTGKYDQNKKPIYKEKTVIEYKDKEILKWIESPTNKTTTQQVQVVEQTTSETVLRTQVNAPWLDPVAIGQLSQLTGSVGPIVRADWFISYAIQPPEYFDFLRLGNTIQDFNNLIFANDQLAAQASAQMKAVVITSHVARNNRTLTREPTFTGGYSWASHDTLKSTDDREYITNFLNEQFDATEDIGSLSNGLQAYFVTDGKGNRLDFANPDVAIDMDSVDHIVRTGRSCMTCHGEGIKPLYDEVRALTYKLQNLESIQLLVPKESDARRVLDLFAGDIDEQIVFDQNYFARAVAATNGLSSQSNAKLLLEIYNYYIEQLLTKSMVARDIGITPDELEKYLRLSTDPVVLGMIKQPLRPVRRDQWEVAYQGFQLLIIGAQTNNVPIQPFVSPTPVYMPPLKK